MEAYDKLREGQLVISKAGRDKGRFFLIYKVEDEQRVYMVDGKLRTLDRPKLKKVKHLAFTNTRMEGFERGLKEEALSDKDIREYIKAYKQKADGRFEDV